MWKRYLLLFSICLFLLLDLSKAFSLQLLSLRDLKNIDNNKMVAIQGKVYNISRTSYSTNFILSDKFKRTVKITLPIHVKVYLRPGDRVIVVGNWIKDENYIAANYISFGELA